MNTTARRGRWRCWSARVALLLAALALAGVLGEVIVRLTPRLRVNMLVSQSDAALGEVYRPGQRVRYSMPEYDHVVAINSHGQHDVEHTWAKPSGVYRILLLGDSYVEAMQVPVEQVFYRRLEEHLNEDAGAQGVRYETIGLGRSGWGAAQELVALEQIGWRYEPDLVVLCFLPDNDFVDSYLPLKRYPSMPYFERMPDGRLAPIPAIPDPFKDSWVYGLCKRSQLVCFVRQNVDLLQQMRADARRVPLRYQVFMEDKPVPWTEAVETTLACVRRMEAVCRERGVGFLCVALTSPVTLGQMDLEDEAQRYPAMRQVAFDPAWPHQLLQDHLGGVVPYVSMVPTFKQHMAATGTPLHFARDGHWTAEGHAVAAAFLYDFLTAGGLVQRAAGSR